MSEFECPVIRVKEVLEHGNADSLEVIKILDGFQVVSQKGLYKAGDLAVYFPEASIMPVPIQEKLGLVGFLSGPDKDRLKAVKLRGELSQGILMRISDLDFEVSLGEDLSEKLGVTKYVPRVPANFAGKWVLCPEEFAPTKYDIENINKVGSYFGDGEEVYITEKLHGTFCQVIIIRNEEDHEGFLRLNEEFQVAVTSKGVGKQGFIMDPHDADAGSNVYVKAMKKFFDLATVEDLLVWIDREVSTCYGFPKVNCVQVMGEIYGSGIQDLMYETTTEPFFRFFDIQVTVPEDVRSIVKEEQIYLNPSFLKCCTEYLEMVPILYFGPFHRSIAKQHAHGDSTLKDGQIREGCVVKPVMDRRSTRGNRIVAKVISEQYLLRKGSKGQKPTEYN